MKRNSKQMAVIQTLVAIAATSVFASGCFAPLEGATVAGLNLASRYDFPVAQPSGVPSPSPSGAPGAGDGVCESFPNGPRLVGLQVTKQVSAGTKGSLIIRLADEVHELEPSQNLCHIIARTDDVDRSVLSICGNYRRLAKGIYELEFDVSSWQKSGEYFVRNLYLIDQAGNRVNYEATYYGNGDYGLLPTYLVKHPSCLERTIVPVARFMIMGNY